MAAHGRIRIGISGWTYKPWRGVFYPDDLPRKNELAFASETFSSIEINGTFYSLQRSSSFAKWAAETPSDFVFAVKAPRYITHIRRLKNVEKPLANFFASGVLRLGQKLGPILWQLPPNFGFEAGTIDSFLKLLPHDTEAAARIAQRHDRQIKDRAWLKTDRKRPLRHALEIRHDSFRAPEFVDLLRRHKVALVCADTVEWPRLGDLTADFVYCRLHGSEELYASGYDGRAIGRWARRVAAWAQGDDPQDTDHVSGCAPRKRKKRDVFVYFDNDRKVRAPRDAEALQRRVDRLLGD